MLSTVHTNDAAGAITRFLDMGIEPFLVSSVMLASIAQRLVRKVCPYCKKPSTPTQAALDFWQLQDDADADFSMGTGCFYCMDKGYKGRTGIYEILMIDEDVQNMVLEKRTAQEITRAMVAKGKLTTLREDAALKVYKGETTFDEAASAIMI